MLKIFLRENPDHFILYIGTNNLNLRREPDLTDKSLVDVALSIKNEEG